MSIKEYKVVRATKSTCNQLVASRHYKRKLGIFWEGFALVHTGRVYGVVCYGQPSAPIQRSAFSDRDFRLYELTRLVIQTETKNAASYLISESLKMLSCKPCAVISYADSDMGHCGIVYQATNWLYTGMVNPHDCMYEYQGEVLHPQTLRDRLGVTSPTKWAKENNVKRIVMGGKHRYFKLVGTRREVASMRDRLKYEVIKSYPKCKKSHYENGQFNQIIVPTDTDQLEFLTAE